MEAYDLDRGIPKRGKVIQCALGDFLSLLPCMSWSGAQSNRLNANTGPVRTRARGTLWYRSIDTGGGIEISTV